MADDRASLWQRLDQIRAMVAWKMVKDIRSKKVLDEYTAVVRGFSAMVHTNGLGQSLAFLFSKSGKSDDKPGGSHTILGSQLTRWLLQTTEKSPFAPYQPPYKRILNSEQPRKVPQAAGLDVLIECLIQADVRAYRRATRETYALLGHLRRFAAGLGESQKTERDSHETAKTQSPAQSG